MRDIKFRAWDGERLRLVWGLGWIDGELDTVNTPKYHGPVDEDIVIMQYTGLKDKNGVEIYEGDIVKRIEGTGYTFVGEVIFEEYGFGIKPSIFFIPLSEKGKYDEGKSSFDFSVEYEIIGNNYENPDLLK